MLKTSPNGNYIAKNIKKMDFVVVDMEKSEERY